MVKGPGRSVVGPVIDRIVVGVHQNPPVPKQLGLWLGWFDRR